MGLEKLLTLVKKPVAGLKKITDNDGDIKLVNLNKPVRALFELPRLYKIFEIFRSEDDAIASFV